MMSQDNKNFNINDPYFDEVKSKTSFSFDFVLWFYRILKYWYLFVISLIICLGIAYVKNKSWIAGYNIFSLVMLEDRGNTSPVAGAVPLGNILRNTVNQQIVMRSRGMVARTVENLPSRMKVNYFRQTRFKTFSLYVNTPVEIEIISLKPSAHNYIFNMAYVDEDHCQIFYEGTDDYPAYSIVVPFGKIVEDKRFTIKCSKAEMFDKELMPFSFTFLTDEQLIGYFNRIGCELVDEDGTALAVTLSGLDPSKDTDFLKAFLDEFQNYNLSLKNQQADLTIGFIDTQLAIINDSLEQSRTTLERFQKETGVYEVASKTLRDDIKEANLKREEIELREKAILVVSDRITTSILGDVQLIDPQMFGLEEPRLSNYVQVYNEALKRHQYVGPNNPAYNKITKEVDEHRGLILAELKLLQSRFQKEKELVQKKYRELEINIDKLPPQERVFVKYQRDYKINEVYQQFLTQRKYEAQIQRASNTPDNFVLEEPRVSGGPVNGGELGKRYMFYLLIGLIVPILFVVLREEVLNFTISTKEECERLSGLPVIGTIENVSKKISKGVTLVKNYPKSSFAESFRNMRVRIEYMAQKDNHVAILVTSTEPADGKTFVATNIASVYQLMGKKVILIDLDLRRPSVAKTLRMEMNKGVSNYLIGQVELEDIIVSHPTYGFDIITAGTLPPNPSELIKTNKTKELLEHLRATYDYVVVDCSPVGLVSDAYILAKIVDTSLFVVRRAKTNKSFFKSVISQVKFDGIENVSLVFNDVKGREGYYGTSRYYGDKTYYLKKNSYYHDDYFEN